MPFFIYFSTILESDEKDECLVKRKVPYFNKIGIENIGRNEAFACDKQMFYLPQCFQ